MQKRCQNLTSTNNMVFVRTYKEGHETFLEIDMLTQKKKSCLEILRGVSDGFVMRKLIF